MAAPTIQNYFGQNAQILEGSNQIDASPENPVLVINFSDFASVGLSNASSFSDPDKLLAAIVKMVKVFSDADTQEEAGTEVSAPTRSFTTRNNQAVIGIGYDIGFFIPDTIGTNLDPDQVI